MGDVSSIPLKLTIRKYLFLGIRIWRGISKVSFVILQVLEMEAAIRALSVQCSHGSVVEWRKHHIRGVV